MSVGIVIRGKALLFPAFVPHHRFLDLHSFLYLHKMQCAGSCMCIQLSDLLSRLLDVIFAPRDDRTT
jgi:hypothetical protein